MTWYQHLVALWDGADYLALIYDPPAEPGADLYVRTGTGPADARQLAAVLSDRGEGQAVHVMRLPENHRFITVSPALANADSLLIALDDTLKPTGDTERRLVLLHTSADGEPRLDSLSRAAVSRSTVSALLAEGLKTVRDRAGRSNGTVIWGVCCTERRLLPQGVNTRSARLDISPCDIVFPEAKHATIELAALTLKADAFDEADRSAGPDLYWPMIAQTVLAEQDRRPYHGIQVRASRSNPFVQWVLRRSAAIHVRRQIMVSEINGTRWQTSVDRLSVPLGSDELAAIGDTPENPEEREHIELTVPAEEPAIRACSLSRLLHDIQAMAGVRTEQGRMLATGDVSADQTTLWFDGAALGDHIGVVSTQSSALRIISGDDVDAEAGNVVMFRVTSSGLEPLAVPADEADALITEVARVQERDLGTEARSDQPNRSLDAARRNLERWSAQQFGGPVQLSFVGIEPLLVMGLASLAAPPGDRSKSLLDLYRHDPALCALLVAIGVDTARLERVALRRPPLADHLLRRFAHANDAADVVAAEGVRPDAEIDALKMLCDPALRGKLLAARITLDSSTDNVREVADAALAALADRNPLATLAQSLRDRGRMAEAQRIAKHLEDFRTGAWITLAQAFELANEVRTWQSEHEAIANRIQEIGTESSAEAIPGGSRSVDAIRKSISEILKNVEPGSDLETSTDQIRQSFDLASLDRRQLVQLENRVLTLVYGPARERLVNEVLGELEEWAGLPEFLSRLSESGDDSEGVRRKGRREGAALLINRVETMQPWRVPSSASADDSFTRSRVDLRQWVATRKHTDTGSGDQLEHDFQSLVVPIGDLFLHHRAFMVLRELTSGMKARLSGDDGMRKLDRQLARGLVKWPDGAADTWGTAAAIAARAGRAEKDRLDAAIVPPGSSAE